MTKLDEFYYQQKEPIAGCLLALRQLLLDFDKSLVEEKWYYRLPCFFYQKKLFCYIWIEKKTNSPYIAFYPGKKLDHPLLELGNRTSSKILRIDPNKDLPLEVIYAITNQSIIHIDNTYSLKS